MAAEAASPTGATSPGTPIDVKPNIIRRPSLIMKPAQTPPTSSPPPNSATATLSLTSKEWVIPPRPKPGRKPATDTPPSKRKAQNRAAQRAFRERRAARVNELEDQIKQIDDENEREQEELRLRANLLEKQVVQCRTELASWIERCHKLEHELKVLKSGRSGSEPSQPLTNTNHEVSDSADAVVGCGKCTLESRCQCIDDAFDTMAGEGPSNAAQDKRPHSPLPTNGAKRVKLEPNDSLEIDFTAMYSRRSASRPEKVSSTSVVADPCGFCSDGTPCICAEMAAEQETTQAVSLQPHQSVAGRSGIPHQLSEFTPPPSEGDVVNLGPSQPSSCSNGPGTCAQCRADPNSTLFCKSLAASRSQSQGNAQEGCSGNPASGGGCCQSLPPVARTTRSRTAAASSSAPSQTPQKPKVTLSCADVYTTLSRHPLYPLASGDIASWLPKLHASDATTADKSNSVNGNVHGRPAMEIDAANVMAVLKDFDRRFGRNA